MSECFPPKAPGVYRIDCAADKKCYVGSTKCLYTRWHIHRHRLRRGTHVNRHLQAAWRKYGEASFSVAVLEIVSDPRGLATREQHWIDLTRCCTPSRGFNICPVARSGVGIVWSEASKKKVAEKHAKDYVVTSPTGEETTIRNLFKFCRDRGLSPDVMHAIAGRRGTAKMHHGWLCRRIGERPRDRPADTRFRSGSYLATSPSGREQLVTALGAFCRKEGLDRREMWRVATGKRKTHRGWKCRVAAKGTDARLNA